MYWLLVLGIFYVVFAIIGTVVGIVGGLAWVIISALLKALVRAVRQPLEASRCGKIPTLLAICGLAVTIACSVAR
jgi:hypothetical protein